MVDVNTPPDHIGPRHYENPHAPHGAFYRCQGAWLTAPVERRNGYDKPEAWHSAETVDCEYDLLTRFPHIQTCSAFTANHGAIVR